MKMLKALIVGLFIWQGMAMANDFTPKYDLLVKKSNKSFEDTYNALVNFLKAKNIPIFADIDHKQNAVDVKLELNPTRVVIFGNPKVGTFLMQDNQEIAFELPLRMAIWQDAKGQVFIAINDMKKLQKIYNLKNQKVVDNIETFLTTVANEVTK
ncbi:DUF302 domain-containing protein [Helicobacter sp. 11S02629-2]|uniref:DUF302 domain-containing protein n=1 Tax=Helicobacter sp. 11S02629-2 TaxID=1476195 RepID=UPI000BA6F49A|nr:DUF302 domain-containing protein [Helicobacter sp. 11S02629-2]PAF45427.1 hypothetical protein BKH40_02875 [Helicobacter sp. 11S02629-2]